MRWFCLSALSLLALGSATPALRAAEPVSYYNQIRPIFQQHCQGCHQPARAQGGYSMTTFAEILKPIKEKPVLVPGKPEMSLLIEQILPDAEKKALMPKNKEALPARDIDLIKVWIAQGAKDDTPATVQDVVSAEKPPVYQLPPVLTALDYSPDGSLLAVSGYHEVLLHKGSDGSGLVARLVGLSERIQSLAFSPDGKKLAVAGGSPGRFGEIQIWNVETKKLLLSHTSTFDTLYGVSWSHDGTRVAFGCADNTLRAIDATTGDQILYQGAHNDWVFETCFSRDSSFLISVSRDRSMKLTEVATQRFIDNVTSITPGALKGGLMTVARNPQKTDRKVVNTEKGTDTSDRWYDELLIAGSDGVPRLYKMHREKKRVIGDDSNRIREYEAMMGRIYAVRFSADGSRFAAGSSLNGTGEVRIYSTTDGKVLARVPTTPIFALAYRPDGKVIAAAGFDGKIRLIDETGKPVQEFVPVPLTPGK